MDNKNKLQARQVFSVDWDTWRFKLEALEKAEQRIKELEIEIGKLIEERDGLTNATKD